MTPNPSPDAIERISTDIYIIRDNMAAHERADEKRFAAVNQTLAGIGADGTPLAIRLDRLEQRQKERSRLLWAVLTVTLGIAGERMIALFSAVPPHPKTTAGGQ